MDTSMMARLKELEVENARLKTMYAEERLKAEILNEASTKKQRFSMTCCTDPLNAPPLT
jgi:hypothetical protein